MRHRACNHAGRLDGKVRDAGRNMGWVVSAWLIVAKGETLECNDTWPSYLTFEFRPCLQPGRYEQRYRGVRLRRVRTLAHKIWPS